MKTNYRVPLPEHNPEFEQTAYRELKNPRISQERRLELIGGLVVNNLRGLAKILERKFHGAVIDTGSIVSEAGIDLVKLKDYDPSRAIFLNYLVSAVSNRIRKSLDRTYRYRAVFPRSLDEPVTDGWNRLEDKLDHTQPLPSQNIEEGERTETLRKILREAVDTAGLSETQRYWWEKKYNDPRGHQRNHDILDGAKPNLIATHLLNAREKIKARYLELIAEE